ncbi:hypothetical protein [Nocardiopsis coralliicola]
MSERDPEWESERAGGDDPRLRRERTEDRHLQEELDDDDQVTEVGMWERYIEDPPEGELDVEEDDSRGELGISDAVAEENRRGGRDPQIPYSDADEEDDGPEGESMHTTRNP